MTHDLFDDESGQWTCPRCGRRLLRVANYAECLECGRPFKLWESSDQAELGDFDMTEPKRVKKGDERFYRTEKGDYPSVTTVLNHYEPKKKAIERANVSDEYVDYAALRGTLAHHRILDQYAMRPLPLPKVDRDVIAASEYTMADLRTDLETIDAMWEDLGFEIEDSAYIEERVVSHEHGFAGTLDALTGGTVVDLKTSKGAFDSHKMQSAAYFHATHELPQLPAAEDAAVIVLHPDPEHNRTMRAEVHRMERAEIDRWFDEFLRVLSKYNKQSKII